MFSQESLLAFAEAANLGSFTAAARKLGKSQSTISAAIANLEIDLGIELFDRSSRKPRLTEPGRIMLARVTEILAANGRLKLAARELAQGLEPRLTIALSDTYESDRFDATLKELQQRYPDLELECLIAECDDLVALVQEGRAQIGLVEAQAQYPLGIDADSVGAPTEIGLFVARNHPLASHQSVNSDELRQHRALRLSTVRNPLEALPRGRSWAAPSYLMLMEMAQNGFGWAPIPRWLVERFGAGSLHELSVRGWPKRVEVDVIWSRLRPLGPVGAWLVERMLK